jgi:hypothetical protein
MVTRGQGKRGEEMGKDSSAGKKPQLDRRNN